MELRPAPSKPTTRRKFLKSVGVMAAGLSASETFASISVAVRSGKKTDIRLENVAISFKDYNYRAPVKFAGAVMDRATLLMVECAVSTRNGKRATGVGYMPFNHIFSFPSKALSQEAKNNAMKAPGAGDREGDQ